MNAATQVVELLVTIPRISRNDAIRMVRQIQADALHMAADHIDGNHHGLMSAFAVATQLRQDADAHIHGDRIGGAR